MIAKASDGKSTVGCRPRIVVDGLQIVLCDDRRPEEPANISRRTIGRGSIRIPRTNDRSAVIDDASCRCTRNARAFFRRAHAHGCVSRVTALTLRVYALILICRPSCPSMVAHGVRTMKRSHLPPRPANTLPDPYRKSGVWADVAPQCKSSCQTASILQRRSNPSPIHLSSFIVDTFLPSLPPSFLHFPFLSHPPFLFPRFPTSSSLFLRSLP